MKVDKGDVLTFRLVVEDPEASQEILGPLMESMGGTLTSAVVKGVRVTASARGDVFSERDAADELLGDVADYLARGHTHDEDACALLDRIELPPKGAK